MNLKGVTYNLTHYFSKHPSRKLEELYASVGIMDLAMAAIIIFEPIYLWKIGYSLQQIMLFYFLIYALYFLLLPLAGKFVAYLGYERSILISCFFLIFFYLSLFLIPYHAVFFILAFVMCACYKSLYWPAYHADFVEYSDSPDRGRQTAGLVSISTIVYVIGPVLGGFIIQFFGFNVLFLVVSILILISNIPLFITKERLPKEQFSYFSTFRMAYKKPGFRSFLAYLGFGEELIVLVVWPIFIFWVIKDYFSIGGLVALTTLITSLILLYIGKMTDKRDKRRLIKAGSVLYSGAWFLRILAATGLHVFFIDIFSRVSKDVISVPLLALTYDRASRSEILKSVVFFEQSLAFGKLLAALIIYILLFFFAGWTAAFVIAGLMTFLYVLL